MQFASKDKFPGSLRPPDIVVSSLFDHFQLSQEYVYQCAIFLILKYEQYQIHSSEIKERPLQS
jgi:hypothetical protein